MARESQGLQIALIVFFMLAVVLATTTFLLGGKFLEAQEQVKDGQQVATEKVRTAADKEAECAELKRMIGLPERSLAELQVQFRKDMQSYGANYPADSRSYSRILSHMGDTILDWSTENTKLKKDLNELLRRFAVREGIGDRRIKVVEAAVKEEGDRAAGAVGDLGRERLNRKAAEADLAGTLGAVRKTGEQSAAKMEAEFSSVREQVCELAEQNRALTKRLERYERTTMDQPQGDVTGVDQRTRTAWINLGRADGLAPQTAFGVYAPGVKVLATKKGGVEVTKIISDHLAEAHITADKDADPIMPGDKVFTPLWSPSKQ